jgi:hypothetical protein
MATSTVKLACLGLDREVVLYGLVKVRSTARSATIGGEAEEGQIGSAPPCLREACIGKLAKTPTFMRKNWEFWRIA